MDCHDQRVEDAKKSPRTMRTSLAAAMTLGLKRGRFLRDARLGCINLLQEYEEGCRANCTYCGLARERVSPPAGQTFIRVPWPEYPLDTLIDRSRAHSQEVRRVCVGMVTHPRALEDVLTVIGRYRRETDMLISALITASLFRGKEEVAALKEAGADRAAVAMDACTPVLFEEHRGRGAGGPHTWEHTLRVLDWCVEVFGAGLAGAHLVVGLGETEREMIAAIQDVRDRGAETHLFSFHPEEGSRLQSVSPPPVGQYRRVQLARYIIDGGFGTIHGMGFNAAGQVTDFGLPIEPFLAEGRAFMTSGCIDESGEVACNRPYGNERPGGPLRNFPFRPEPSDLAQIRSELWEGLEGRG